MSAGKKREYRDLIAKMRGLAEAAVSASEKELYLEIAASYERQLLEMEVEEERTAAKRRDG